MQAGQELGNLGFVDNQVQLGFGLQLTSDLPIPGAVPAGTGDPSRIVRIELGRATKTAHEPGFDLASEGIVYRHPIGLFHCAANRIFVEPDSQSSLQDLGEYLVANALPALLWQQEAFMLHAACVRLPAGLTVAIAGQSGAGKSRLAASLVAGGGELIGDDSLALYETDQGILAKGLPGGWFERSPDGQSREFMPLECGPSRGESLLDLLVVLDCQDQAPAPLSAVGALTELIRHRHRPKVPLLLGRQGKVLAQAARIQQWLPIVRLGAQALRDENLIATGAALVGLAQPRACGSPRTAPASAINKSARTGEN